MKVTFFTGVPDLITTFWLSHPILRRLSAGGICQHRVVDIKSHGYGVHKKVDDYAAGGGGMVMRPDVLADCIDAHLTAEELSSPTSLFVYMSPRGVTLRQALAQEVANTVANLFILCGRFEGVDQRIIDYYNIKEISLGDYVLMGGEIAGLALVESIARLLPNAISSHTLDEESFSPNLQGMLEYDHFTKPRNWRGMSIPDVLLSGNHAEVRKWRLQNSAIRTKLANK